jgi:histidine triad (HIT) family protein
MGETVFSKIIKGEIPAEKVFENESVLGFKDLMPQAPIHLLFIHKVATKNINELTRQHPEQLVELFSAVEQYTRENELEEAGFRIVTNTNRDGGQTVFHTHLHVLGGAPLGGFGRSRS